MHTVNYAVNIKRIGIHSSISGHFRQRANVVEAFSCDLSVVSTDSSAIGIPVEKTGNKLLVLPDYYWTEFTRQVILLNPDKTISPDYFKYFYWDNIAAKAPAVING